MLAATLRRWTPHTPNPDGLAWAQRLVRFNTVSRESNLPLIECIADHLRTLGVPLRLTCDDDRRKANLFATLGDGQAGRPGAVGPHRHRALGRPGLDASTRWRPRCATAACTAAAVPT